MEIQGYPDYIIHANGYVYNKKHNRFLKHYNRGGYLSVGLSKEGKREHFKVHRLIARHYLLNPENYPLVDHIDRNKFNNHKDNLRWCTHTTNSQNREMHKNNKLRIQYIHEIKPKEGFNYWRVCVVKNGKKYQKTFTQEKYSLEDAVVYRDELLKKI